MTAKNNHSFQKRQMQQSLYHFARNDLNTFPNLYEKIYRPYVLKEAWEQIRQKLAGRANESLLHKAEVYGIDKLLSELRSELQYEAYRVSSFPHETAENDFAWLKNDIAQAAAKIILSPIFKAGVTANTGRFRSLDQLDAFVEKLRYTPDYKDCNILNIQIKSCFDSISQGKLMELLELRVSDQELLYLIRHWLNTGSIYRKESPDNRNGIDKNLVIAPMLMSIYLSALDLSWEKQYKNSGIWLRYADHIRVLCKDGNHADRTLKLLPSFLEQFDLDAEIEQTGSYYIPLSEEVSPKQSEPVLPEEAPYTPVSEAYAYNDSFCGYKYRFGLYAGHSNVNDCDDDNIHFHNFMITLYIHAGNRTDDNFGLEKIILDWLAPLQGQRLSKSDLFLGKETTIEGIGNTLFDPLYELIQPLGYELVKLSIYDNPIRVYSVSYKRLDSTVNTISDISLDCIPVLNLEEDIEAVEPVEPLAEAAILTTAALRATSASSVKAEVPAAMTQEEEFEKELELILGDESDTDQVSDQGTQEHTPNVIVIILQCILGLGCFAALAALTMYIVKDGGRYPQGYDTFCHLYRADLLLKNIQQGNWFPLYDGTWYNGVEIMRYWGPLPLYLLAGLEWMIQGSILNAYILFLGVLLIIGGCGWLLWGITYHRIGLSVLIGLIWFFMPENMRVVILEGNLPRGVINALLPFFFYFLWRVIAEKRRRAILPLILITSLITLCHLGITLMLLTSALIFILIHTSLNHATRSSLSALGATLSGVLLAGLWVVPALIGGAASGSSTNQVMMTFFENVFTSLNPITRISGDIQSFYFGLSIFLLCILGMLCGPKNSKAGFITAVILLICTSKSVFELFVKLPFSQFLWMIRFIPIGLAVAMVSFILWKQLKKWAVLLLALLLVADCSTSYRYIYIPPELKITDVKANLDKRADQSLIRSAKNITSQRLAFMDLSKNGSFAPYYITGVGRTVNYTFGAGWEGASTASNIVQLNASVESGWYVYLFDRALELGNDTVLIPIDNLKDKSKDLERLVEAAAISGFYPVENDGFNILFHKDTPEQFGVITHYEAIAIGEAASGIAMIFPDFEEGSKTNLNDYSFEELISYRTIYLSGFTYDDKTAAEELLNKLAESGANIYIDMNRVPVDPIQKSMELFGVTSHEITFSDTFPVFTYQDTTYTSLDFNYNLGDWNTVYLLGLENVEGSCDMTNRILPFLGTARNKNLHFIGMNIMYYLQTTRDMEIQKMVEAIISLDDNTVPERKVVPLNIQKDNHQITIQSDYDQVNTTLSYIDIFQSNQEIHTVNNLITVNNGTTVILMKYPHTEKGLAVTAIGILLALLSFASMKTRKEHKPLEQTNESLSIS